MKRHIFPIVLLILLLLIQGCATPQRKVPTPYPSDRKEPRTPTPIEREISRPSPGKSIERPPISRPRSPLITKFISQAERQMHEGHLEAAAQTLERGIGIAPKDALLWSQLATIRLRQRQYDQAISLATKSNNLAGADTALLQKNQIIIKEAQKCRR